MDHLEILLVLSCSANLVCAAVIFHLANLERRARVNLERAKASIHNVTATRAFQVLHGIGKAPTGELADALDDLELDEKALNS